MKLTQGLGTVRDCVFLGGVELGGSEVAIGKKEVGVVTEAVGAARGVDDEAVEGAFGVGEFGLTIVEDHGTDEAGRALFEWDIFEFIDEFGVVGGVDDVAWAFDISVAGTADAGLAVKSIDDEAGVVGEAGVACFLSVVFGLDEGVIVEGVGIFNRFGEVGVDVFEGEHLEAEVCENVVNFF